MLSVAPSRELEMGVSGEDPEGGHSATGALSRYEGCVAAMRPSWMGTCPAPGTRAHPQGQLWHEVIM